MGNVFALRPPRTGWVVAVRALALATLMALAGRAPVEAQPAQADIVDTAVAAGGFNTLATALSAAGLVDTLKGPGPYTVFAPTDEAFARLPAGTVEQLLADPEQLRAVLTYHVVPGTVTATEAAGLTSAPTVQGEALRIQPVDGGLQVNQANVEVPDVMASNGVIHAIDSVLVPPSVTGQAHDQME